MEGSGQLYRSRKRLGTSGLQRLISSRVEASRLFGLGGGLIALSISNRHKMY